MDQKVYNLDWKLIFSSHKINTKCQEQYVDRRVGLGLFTGPKKLQTEQSTNEQSLSEECILGVWHRRVNQCAWISWMK